MNDEISRLEAERDAMLAAWNRTPGAPPPPAPVTWRTRLWRVWISVWKWLEENVPVRRIAP